MPGNQILGVSSNVETLLDAVTSTGAGGAKNLNGLYSTFQAILSNTVGPSATVDVEVSNDGINWIVMGTIILSIAGETDGFSSNAGWNYVRGNVTAIGGASTSVTLIMGG